MRPASTDYIATERLYLNRAGQVVRGDDPDRQTLLVAVGGRLPRARALAYGLIPDPEPDPVPKALPAPPVTKAVRGPRATK